MMNHIFSIKRLISSQIQMNMLFMTKDEIKRSRRDRNIHKAKKIPFDIHDTNEKITFTVQLKNACKLESSDHLWLPYFY